MGGAPQLTQTKRESRTSRNPTATLYVFGIESHLVAIASEFESSRRRFRASGLTASLLAI
jgi:hypothetical protein